MKAWTSALQGEPLVPTVSYLNNFTKTKSQKWEFSMAGIVNALQAVAAK